MNIIFQNINNNNIKLRKIRNLSFEIYNIYNIYNWKEKKIKFNITNNLIKINNIYRNIYYQFTSNNIQ